MYGGSWRLSFLPELRGYNNRVLWEVHYEVWRRAWWSSWLSSLTSRRSRRRPANSSRRRGRHCRMFNPPDVAFRGPCRSGSCVLQWWRGTRRSRTPQDGVLACTSGGSGDTWRSRTTRGGRSGTPAACAERPSWRGTWRRRTPSQAGGGSGTMRVMRWSPDGRSWQNSTGAVPSASRPASQVSQCCHSVRDGGAVTGVGGWDSGHSHCGEWRPDAVCPEHWGGVVGIQCLRTAGG